MESRTDEAEKQRQARRAAQQAVVARIVEETRKREAEEEEMRQVRTRRRFETDLSSSHRSDSPSPLWPPQLQEMLVQEQMEAARLAEEAKRREQRQWQRQEMAAAYEEQVRLVCLDTDGDPWAPR